MAKSKPQQVTIFLDRPGYLRELRLRLEGVTERNLMAKIKAGLTHFLAKHLLPKGGTITILIGSAETEECPCCGHLEE